MKSAKNPFDYDVIIAGAGPVGLFLAGELALAHCSVLLLEKAENPPSPLKQLPFGLQGLNAPSVEALYRRGLLQELEVPKRLKNSYQNAGQGSRRQVGHFAGTEPEFTGYTVQADLADPEQLRPGRNLTPTGMYMQSQPGYLVIQDFDNGAFHSSGKPITLAHVQEVLRRVSDTDVTISALHLATTWTDRSRQATTYRNGRVLLAGDAAHIHAPLGGQGLNLGLGDALNLGWKLAATIHGQAPAGLLDSYHTERYPLGAQALDWSRAQVAVMRPGPQARALQAIIRNLLHTRDGATYFAGRVWGIATHYPLGDDHPLVGHSVPNFEFVDGTTIGELMHDGQGILLDFESNASLKTLASVYGNRMSYVSGRAKDSLGLSAVLIRPDGIVAWAADHDPDGRALQLAAARWFVANAEIK